MCGGTKSPPGMTINGFAVPGGMFFGSNSALAAARLSVMEKDIGGVKLRLGGMSIGAEGVI